MNLSDIWGAHDEPEPEEFEPVVVGEHSMLGIALMISEINRWISEIAFNSAMDEMDVRGVLSMTRDHFIACRNANADWWYETNDRSNKLILIRDKVRSEIERVEKINRSAREIVAKRVSK